jgi:hypothetical protein
VEFHDCANSTDLQPADFECFLTMLEVDRKVSASMQNQALAAILFLYKDVLEIELPRLSQGVRVKASQRLSSQACFTDPG